MKLKDVMMRAKCGVLVALFAVLGAETAFGDKFVTYWDPDLRSDLREYAAPITEDTSELMGGFYYVEGNISLDHRLFVRKIFHKPNRIILMDGASLVVRGQGVLPGLEMNYDTEKLEIYGQRGGTGTLSVYGGGNAPGINMGSVTVYGGRVKAYGGANAPGMCSTRVEVRGGSLEAFGKNGQLGIGGWGQYFVGDAWNLVWTNEAGGRDVSLKKRSGYQNCETPYIRIARAWPVTADTSEIRGDEWYIAEGAVSRAGHTGITVNGSAHLILWDGCDLKVTAGEEQAGIDVTSGNELEILGLPTGTGKLTATGGRSGAGIGSHYACDAGVITINGGTVTATDIGGGVGGSGGVITINGGTVTATGSHDGAGIGGGSHGSGGVVTINGGTVRANGGNSGAGIGGGIFASGGTVTINGGTVTATGGRFGAGIGGGDGGAGGTVAINGGTVTATGSLDGAGIGGGCNGSGGVVTINGGTVTATGGAFGAGIGGGYQSSGGVVTINGGTVTARSVYCGVGIGGGQYGDGGTVTIDGGSTKASSIQSQPKNGKKQDVHCVSAEIEWLSVEMLRVEGLEGYGTKDIVPIDGRVYLYLPNGTHAFALSDGTKTLHYYAVVNGRDVTVEPLEWKGFFVNGKDIGQESGAGWGYWNNVLHITDSSRTYVLSGLATNDEVQVSIEAGDTTLVLSNAVVCTRGRAALTVGHGLDGVVLGMAGGVSYLVATNNPTTGEPSPAIRAESGYEIDLAPGGDRLESMICVFNSGNEQAVMGSAPRVFGGTFSVWADETAVQPNVEYDSESEIMAVGDNPGSVRYATGSSGAKCVIVAPFCRVRVPVEIPGIRSYVVEDTTQPIGPSETVNATNVFKVMVHEDVKIEFTAVEGYDIISNARIDIPSITSDVTLAAADLPQVGHVFTVTIPAVDHAVCKVMTSSDGEILAKGSGEWTILSNAEVKVSFTADEYYRITANGEKTWTLEYNVVFGETAGFPLPTIEVIPGTIADPWIVGENVTAYTNGTTLVIEGSGAMSNFVNAADVPWNRETVEGVVIGEGVSQVGKNALAGLADAVTVNGSSLSTYRTVSSYTTTINGMPLDDYNAGVRFLNVGEEWQTGPVAAQSPSGAISGAEFERIDIVDGKALLDVSVYTSNTLTNENWSVATNGVIEVPAEGKQGFFILKSKPSVPSDAPHSPITILE